MKKNKTIKENQKELKENLSLSIPSSRRIAAARRKLYKKNAAEKAMIAQAKSEHKLKNGW